MIRFRARKGINLLPFLRMNITQAGVRSFTWHLGRFWSWNSKTHIHSINTPGWGGIQFGGRKRREPGGR